MINKIVTHSAKFHADEVFAVSVLLYLYPQAQVIRTRDEEVLRDTSESTIMVDVGGGRYDHHEAVHPLRKNGDKYSSAGLVWRDFGIAYVRKYVTQILGEELEEKLLFKMARVIDDRFVSFIDKGDNGIFIKLEDGGKTTFSSGINSFNRKTNTPQTQDLQFVKAVVFCSSWLENLVHGRIEAHQANLSRIEFEEVVKSQDNPTILVLDKVFDWKPLISPHHQALFVIHQEDSGKWVTMAIPEIIDGVRVFRKLLPLSWAGKRDEELEMITKVQGSKFCHNARFIASSLTRDSAILLAVKACNE